MEGCGSLLAWGFVSALIGALIGKHLRNQAGFGALLGLFLGPVGWVITFALSDRRRKCPECRSAVPDDATKCRHCGSTIGPVTPTGAYAVSKAAKHEEMKSLAWLVVGGVLVLALLIAITIWANL